MSDIFLSYAREDRETAEALASAFSSRGWSVWWDRELVIGTSYEFKIEEELAAAKCVVVLWSRDSVKSEWVRNEAGEGNDRDVLVPASIAPVKPPLAFRGLQTADLVGWRGDGGHPGFADLCRAIAATAGGPAGPVPMPPGGPRRKPPPPPPWYVRSRAVLLALIPVVAVITVVVAAGLVRSDDDKVRDGPAPLRVVVRSDVEWTRARPLVAGEIVDIRATGEIDTATDQPGRTSGPDGIAGEENHDNNVVAGVAHAALIARLEHEERPLRVGSSLRYRAPAAGVLLLGVNDKGRENNGGSFEVTITRVDQP